MLALTGCMSQEAVTPIRIPHAKTSVKSVDLRHLPELAAPAVCAGYVALTFDDGPTELTSDILAVLDHYKVPAAFFNLGAQEQARSRLVELAEAAGHQLGNHTMTHPDLLSTDLNSVLADIDAATVVHRDLSHDYPTLFRPPFGNTSPELRSAVERRGMVEVLWTVDSKDFEADSAEQVVEASKGMTDGGILLLHDGKPVTLEALPLIIEHYYGQDLCFGQVVATDTELSTDLPGVTHRARASEQES
jgi:peptidoglycan/xylan/chitin deacetylase (PgdA/CDA1 family)